MLERRGANEQTVRISGFVEMDGVGLCEKRRPENGVCLAPIAIGVFDYFLRQGKKSLECEAKPHINYSRLIWNN